MLPRQITLPQLLRSAVTPLLRYSCKLFVAPQKVNSFGIKQIQTLSAKHPGVGVPHTVCLGLLRRDARLLSALCFHGLTNCFSRNPFSFTNICIAPRCTPRGANSQIRNLISTPPRSLRLPAAGRAQRHLLFFGLSEPFKRSDIPTFSPFSARMLVNP
jgi:hypothetical protein